MKNKTSSYLVILVIIVAAVGLILTFTGPKITNNDALVGEAFKSTAMSCTDETDDGVDFFSKGSIKDDKANTIVDECDGNILKETYCDSNSKMAIFLTFDCSQFGPGLTCDDGACIGDGNEPSLKAGFE